MRHLLSGVALAAAVVFAFVSSDAARAQPYRAGLTMVSVPDAEPFDALVTYPTQASEAPVAFGHIVLSASRDGAIATGKFPVVLFSHGNGRGPGTPLMHRDLLLHLAREGFIVVAPFHPAAGRPFEARPRQMRKALEQTLVDSRFVERADRTKVGMMGFSFGGAVGLLSAGALLDLSRLSAYCSGRPDDPRVCDGIPTDGSLNNVPPRRSQDAIPLKALVLMEPYGAAFARNGLASLTLPVLIYYATQSDLRNDRNALALANALPRTAQVASVPGGHFVFMDKCPAEVVKQAAELCTDADGIDRAAGLAQVRQKIAEFLRGNLR